MSNKLYWWIYALSIPIYIGLFIWYYAENWAGDIDGPQLAMAIYSVFLALTVATHIFRRSRFIRTKGGAIAMRIISYIIFILVAYYVVVFVIMFGTLSM